MAMNSENSNVFTHEHKDHIAGLDDVRAFNFKQKRDMEVYDTIETVTALKREFHYAFADNPYPGVPKINLNNIFVTSQEIEKY